METLESLSFPPPSGVFGFLVFVFFGKREKGGIFQGVSHGPLFSFWGFFSLVLDERREGSPGNWRRKRFVAGRQGETRLKCLRSRLRLREFQRQLS